MEPQERKIKLLLESKPTLEGAGVHLRRVFGFAQLPMFDPFLMLDDFRSDTPDHYIKGFPWHPHRGIETITYVLAGDVEHGDSMGNKGVISSGDVQWMTAGSGIVHQEMPRGDARGSMHGFQLWANLPASQKMMHPRYRSIDSQQIPEVRTQDGTKVKVIAGKFQNIQGPVTDVVIDPEFLDCTIPEGGIYTHAARLDYTAFIYVIDGRGLVGDTQVSNRNLVLFENGDRLTVKAHQSGVRFLLMTGKPLNEPVAWRGPIVMNTEQELETAFMEYQQGTFVKHAKPH